MNKLGDGRHPTYDVWSHNYSQSYCRYPSNIEIINKPVQISRLFC